MDDDRRNRPTLRDVVVAFVVLMGLAFLFFPTVQTIHELRPIGQCQNNMRQIGLGLMGFANSKEAYPNAGTFLDDPERHKGDPTKSSIYPFVSNSRGTGGNPKVLLRSWVVDILPYIDNQELYNAWNFQRDYLDTASTPDMPSNYQFSSNSINILRCPEDKTAVAGQGNLSYAVNGGFVRWPAVPLSWTGSAEDGASGSGPLLHWVPLDGDWKESQSVGRRLGVMFLGTQTGDQPWDIKTTSKDIKDGEAHTLLVGENALVGYSKGTSPYAGRRETNWACPLPNFVMFLGSDDVCQSNLLANDCLAGQLARGPDGKDGPGWARANLVGTSESIGFGRAFTVEGSFPFANSRHRGGCNFVFCDGSVRYLRDTIDGTLYSKLITPTGGSLPEAIRQSRELDWSPD